MHRLHKLFGFELIQATKILNRTEREVRVVRKNGKLEITTPILSQRFEADFKSSGNLWPPVGPLRGRT